MSIFVRLQKFAISRKPMGNTFAKERICPHFSHNINSDFDISHLFKSEYCLYYFNSGFFPTFPGAHKHYNEETSLTRSTLRI